MKTERRKVQIEIKNETGGECFTQTIPGEYMFRNGEHILAYTDLAGNAVTDTGLVFTNKKALLHRSGAITGDMLFEQDNITSSDYNAFGIPTFFNVHTNSYQLTESNKAMQLAIGYSLYGNPSEEAIECKIQLDITLV